jgi:hypothetical protein
VTFGSVPPPEQGAALTTLPPPLPQQKEDGRACIQQMAMINFVPINNSSYLQR